jgi:hypothetical protein
VHKELHSIQLIRDYLVNKRLLQDNTSNINEIYSFFKNLSSPISGKKFNSLYILNYINQFIVSDDVAKRKTSARVFEDLLAILFNGEIADNKKRKNLKSEVPEYFKLTKDKIAGNKREKIDLLFNNNYGVSLKTLMMDNKEINLGSFEKNVLFDGFNVKQYLNERKTESEIGLGSKPRLHKLLSKIQADNNYTDFQKRFEEMFSFIFSDDMILAIKDGTKLHMYFFTGDEFTKFLTSRANNIDSLLEVVNRWEGNSIRVDRTKLIQSCNKTVVLDLTRLDNTVISMINELDYKLHETYVEYFNKDSNQSLKIELLETIDKLFQKFEEEIVELK